MYPVSAGNKYSAYIFVNERILCLICSRDYKHLSSLKFVCFESVSHINLFLLKFRIAFIFICYKYNSEAHFFMEGL